MKVTIDIVQLIIAIAASTSAAFTALLFLIARRELKKNNAVNKAEFYNQLKRDFLLKECIIYFFL